VLSKRVFDLATLSAGSRIRAELLRLGESSATTVGKAVLYPAPSDADIAAHVAATRETVNRELGEMIEAGAIERRGRTMIILDVEKVRQLIATHPADGLRPSAKGPASLLPDAQLARSVAHRRLRLPKRPELEAVH